MKKIIELAYIRNKLVSGRFNEEDKELASKIKQNILSTNSLFNEIAINAINNCENDIIIGDLRSAAQEIQLIHNFTFYDFESWNQDHFYRVELLSYIELANNSDRIKKLISMLAKLL